MKNLFTKKNITIVESESSLVYISHPSTVVGLFINANNEVLLVEQYREIFNKSFLELPGGLIEKNENTTEAIKREFLEETGYVLNDVELITSVIPSIGLSNEVISIFKVSSERKIKQNLDGDEEISIKWVPFQECLSLIKRNEITDAKTIIGILSIQI